MTPQAMEREFGPAARQMLAEIRADQSWRETVNARWEAFRQMQAAAARARVVEYRAYGEAEWDSLADQCEALAQIIDDSRGKPIDPEKAEFMLRARGL